VTSTSRPRATAPGPSVRTCRTARGRARMPSRGGSPPAMPEPTRRQRALTIGRCRGRLREVAGETTNLAYPSAAVVAFWVVPFFVAWPIGVRKGLTWLPWTLLGWFGVIALSAQPPDTQALALRRRGGLGGYRVAGAGPPPRHVRVPATGPGAAGLRSALSNS